MSESRMPLRRGALGPIAALGVIIATGAGMLWAPLSALLEPLGAEPVMTTLAAKEHAAPASATITLPTASIQSLNLFGHLTLEPKAIDAEKLPDTPLALQLVGIIGHSNAATARSLIAEAGKPAQPYFPGDALPGNAKLVRIDRRFVIVQRGEHLEKLQFAAASAATKVPARRRSITEAVTEMPSQPAALNSTDPEDPAIVYDGLRERLVAIRRAQEKP